MPLKINISDRGKAYKVELEGDVIFSKILGDKIDGKDIKPELEGYELEITGGSDIAGFPMKKDVEGIGLRRVMLTKGWGMHDKKKGIRLRKTVRGNTISEKTVQVNMIVTKEGGKKLDEIFKPAEEPKTEGEVDSSKTDDGDVSVSKDSEVKEEKKEEVKVEEKKEEVKTEEKKEEQKPKE